MKTIFLCTALLATCELFLAAIAIASILLQAYQILCLAPLLPSPPRLNDASAKVVSSLSMLWTLTLTCGLSISFQALLPPMMQMCLLMIQFPSSQAGYRQLIQFPSSPAGYRLVNALFRAIYVTYLHECFMISAMPFPLSFTSGCGWF